MEEEQDHASGVLAQAFWKAVMHAFCAMGLCVAFGWGGCERLARHKPAAKDSNANGNSTVRTDIPADAVHKLQELNKWERDYGNRVAQRTNYDVPGEAQAYMDQLKQELSDMGFAAKWDTQIGEYVLVRKGSSDKDLK